MAFRVKDLLIAVAPVGIDGRLIDFPNALDTCTRCTGLTPDCPGCSRVQCSDYPTRNYGRDFTIYEAVQEFQAAQLGLVQAQVKLAEQKSFAMGKERTEARAEEDDLEALEERLEDALEEVRRQRKAAASG